MPRLKTASAADPAVRDANRLVSYNLARARRSRGWTQVELAERLEPLLGFCLTKSSVSSMERNTQARKREFDAGELTAFSLVFDLPVSWFFLPSPEVGLGDATVAQALAVVIGGDAEQALMCDRFGEITEQHPEQAGRCAEQASEAIGSVGWEWWSTVRAEWLEACVEQERHGLDEFFERMGTVVETYRAFSISELVVSEQP